MRACARGLWVWEGMWGTQCEQVRWCRTRRTRLLSPHRITSTKHKEKFIKYWWWEIQKNKDNFSQKNLKRCTCRQCNENRWMPHPLMVCMPSICRVNCLLRESRFPSRHLRVYGEITARWQHLCLQSIYQIKVFFDTQISHWLQEALNSENSSRVGIIARSSCQIMWWEEFTSTTIKHHHKHAWWQTFVRAKDMETED